MDESGRAYSTIFDDCHVIHKHTQMVKFKPFMPESHVIALAEKNKLIFSYAEIYKFCITSVEHAKQYINFINQIPKKYIDTIIKDEELFIYYYDNNKIIHRDISVFHIMRNFKSRRGWEIIAKLSNGMWHNDITGICTYDHIDLIMHWKPKRYYEKVNKYIEGVDYYCDDSYVYDVLDCGTDEMFHFLINKYKHTDKVFRDSRFKPYHIENLKENGLEIPYVLHTDEMYNHYMNNNYEFECQRIDDDLSDSTVERLYKMEKISRRQILYSKNNMILIDNPDENLSGIFKCNQPPEYNLKNLLDKHPYVLRKKLYTCSDSIIDILLDDMNYDFTGTYFMHATRSIDIWKKLFSRTDLDLDSILNTIDNNGYNALFYQKFGTDTPIPFICKNIKVSVIKE